MEAWYLAALKLWTERTGDAPRIHELAGWLNKSPTAVYSALIALEHKGHVTRVGVDQSIKSNRRFRVAA
jgi:predicted transcriptional regulator